MRSTRFRYSIVLFLVLVPIVLNACDSGSSDPPVTPDTTIPSTLVVTVSIAEDQEASNGQNGNSIITLGFSTKEVAEINTVIFIHGESVNCNGSTMALGNFTNYWFRVSPSPTYTCTYYYFLHGVHMPETIFSFQAPHSPLSPILQRPVNNSSFIVHYNSGSPNPNVNPCMIQVTANAPNGNATGSTVPQNGNMYTGSDVSALNGLGNILMTRICVPINYNHNNDANDAGLKFAGVNVTYTSTASYEVSWIAPGSPTQGTNS